MRKTARVDQRAALLRGRDRLHRGREAPAKCGVTATRLKVMITLGENESCAVWPKFAELVRRFSGLISLRRESGDRLFKRCSGGSHVLCSNALLSRTRHILQVAKFSPLNSSPLTGKRTIGRSREISS